MLDLSSLNAQMNDVNVMLLPQVSEESMRATMYQTRHMDDF